jgi:hypothetical protein
MMGIFIKRTVTMFDEHQIAIDGKNPESCTPEHNCGGHGKSQKHGPIADIKRFRTATTPTTR